MYRIIYHHLSIVSPRGMLSYMSSIPGGGTVERDRVIYGLYLLIYQSEKEKTGMAGAYYYFPYQSVDVARQFSQFSYSEQLHSR